MIAQHKPGLTMAAAEKDLQDLLDYTRVIAEDKVTGNAMAPFAVTVLATNTTSLVSKAAARDGHSAVTGIEALKLHLKSCTDDDALKACAIAYEVSVHDRESGHLRDAVAVNLDHRQDLSLVVYFPYEIEAGLPKWGAAFQQAGRSDIFR